MFPVVLRLHLLVHLGLKGPETMLELEMTTTDLLSAHGLALALHLRDEKSQTVPVLLPSLAQDEKQGVDVVLTLALAVHSEVVQGHVHILLCRDEE